VPAAGKGKSECLRPLKKLGESQGDRKPESGPSCCSDGSIMRSDLEKGIAFRFDGAPRSVLGIGNGAGNPAVGVNVGVGRAEPPEREAT
jgi:hypothetical protein